jgi:hypothetical protein
MGSSSRGYKDLRGFIGSGFNFDSGPDEGSDGSGGQAQGTSTRLKDLQHSGAEHSLAMLNAAEYEAIELAAAGHKVSHVVTHFKVTHIYNPSKDIDLDFDFGTHNGLVSLSMVTKDKTLEMAYLDFDTRDGLTSPSVATKGKILEKAYLDSDMRAAAVLADVEIEADGKAEQVAFGIIKEHGKARASSACASSGCAPFNILKIIDIEMPKEGLYAKVAMLLGYRP